MKTVIQRVKSASLSIEGKEFSKIKAGLLVFVGIETTDTKKEADYLISKLPKLRIFEDENAKLNKSLLDIGGEIMVVSNFTLCGETKGYNRPSFITAGKPEMAKPLYEHICAELSKVLPTKTGIFGADMQISAHLDGPINILI